MKREETNQRRPVLLFSSCKCAVILQPIGGLGGGRLTEAGIAWMGTVFVLEQGFSFMQQQNCVCVCLQIKMISGGGSLGDKWRCSVECTAAVLCLVLVADV